MNELDSDVKKKSDERWSSYSCRLNLGLKEPSSDGIASLRSVDVKLGTNALK